MAALPAIILTVVMRTTAILLLLTLACCAPALASPRSQEITRQGIELLDAGRYNEALTLFERAVSEDPRDPVALFHQARAANRIGMHTWARRDLEAAAKLGYDGADLDFELGWALLKEGRYEQAADRLRAFDAVVPPRGETSLLLAQSLQALGRFDESADRLDRAAALDPLLKSQADALRASMKKQSEGAELARVAQRDGVVRTGLIHAALIGWIALTLGLFKLRGPRTAILIAVVGGYVLLPGKYQLTLADGMLHFDRWHSIGLAVMAGVLLFDFGRLRRARPAWSDLAVLLYCLVPAAAMLANDLHAWQAGVARIVGDAMYLAVPYAAGRLYFADGPGVQRLARAVIIAALLMSPILVYEMLVGPRGYVLGVVYGLPFEEQMVGRLGAWRPEGFIGNGIEVSAFLAAAVVATLCHCLARTPEPLFRVPMWVVTCALLIMTMLCRGIYGYALLATGVIAALITTSARTRIAIAVLLLFALLYISLRYTGAWDGRQMVDLARVVQPQRVSSLAWRIDSENEHVQLVSRHGPWLGLGQRPASDIQTLERWPDGRWLHELRQGGLIRLVLWLAAFYLVPTTIALSRAGRISCRSPQGAAIAALALLLALDLLNSLHNSPYPQILPLAGGALAGWATSCASQEDRIPQQL